MISVLLPVFFPLIFMVIVALLPMDQWRPKIALVGFALHTSFCAFLLWICRHGAIEVIAVGDTVFLADLFTCIFLFAISLVFLAANLYRIREPDNHVFRIPLIFVLQSALCLTLLTADFFTLFVSIELMLVASYGLVSIELPDKYIKWAFSYLLVNLIGTLGFLCATAMIYGYTGHVNIAAIAALLREQYDNPLLLRWGYLIFGVLGLKAGIFPLFFLLPRTYSRLPSVVSALFTASLTKVAVYLLIRVFVVLLPGPFLNLNKGMLIVSTLTMFLGALGAVASSTIRSILSYQTISQIGYMILGLSLYTPLAVAAALIFIVHNIWVKASLYLIGGVAQQACGSDDLKKMGNLASYMPWFTGLFFIQALSFSGFPPLSGFWGGYLLVSESLRQENYLVSIISLLTGWLTLFNMLKIWIGAFWKRSNRGIPIKKLVNIREKYLSISMLVCASLLLGFGAEPVYQKATLAAQQIFHKEAYIQAVLKLTSVNDQNSNLAR